AHTYMHFDFGADEDKAQEARHKLDVWKQAFRLDKKLQYKLDRPEDEVEEDEPTGSEEQEQTEEPKAKSTRASHKSGDDEKASITLQIRLYFSSHEKLSEQRWLDRIPTEEPFKNASPKVIRKSDAGFDDAVKQFGNPERNSISG
ncbi:MAG TPA: hypothetical protein VIM00_10675, partial [Candidatus Acidoferrum sp.]